MSPFETLLKGNKLIDRTYASLIYAFRFNFKRLRFNRNVLIRLNFINLTFNIVDLFGKEAKRTGNPSISHSVLIRTYKAYGTLYFSTTKLFEPRINIQHFIKF